MWADRKAHPEPFTYRDFFPPVMPGRVAVPAGPSEEQLRSKLIMWAAMMNKADEGQLVDRHGRPLASEGS